MCSLILEREEGGEKQRDIDTREKHPSAASHIYPDQGLNLHLRGMCPDWESNPRSFGVWEDAPTYEPHRPGQDIIRFFRATMFYNTQRCVTDLIQRLYQVLLPVIRYWMTQKVADHCICVLGPGDKQTHSSYDLLADFRLADQGKLGTDNSHNFWHLKKEKNHLDLNPVGCC